MFPSPRRHVPAWAGRRGAKNGYETRQTEWRSEQISKQGVSVLGLWRSAAGNCRERNSAEEYTKRMVTVHQKGPGEPGFTYDVHLSPLSNISFISVQLQPFRDVNHA